MPDDDSSPPTRTITEQTATLRESQPPSRPQLQEGEWVAGRYRVEALVGRGGYGEVYRVVDTRQDGRRVALKLHRLRALSRSALDSLKSEFALLASLSHPNLATVHDFAYVEGEYAFFTQNLIEGVPLGRAQLDVLEPRSVRMIAQLCRALDYLHGRGIVHGDVKPGNIIVDVAHEHLTLLDFGVSRALGASTGARVVGSPPYMAPELITGSNADGRTDLYALGITLFQLVTGNVPFRGSSTQIMMAQVEEPPPSLPGNVPIPLQALIARLIAKNPDERPPTASAVLSDLSRIARVPIEIDTTETLASHVLSARMVGRERELERIVGDASAPGPTTSPLVVEGEAGTGKSRLLREARQRVQLRGQQWIHVQTPRSEGGPTLLAHLARALLGPTQLAALSDEDRIELARALPELRRPRERIAIPLDPEAARRRRLAILGRKVASRFAWKPGVLAVEDLHWAKPAQQRELAGVIGEARNAGARCLVVVASRPDGLDAETVETLGAGRVECSELEPAAAVSMVETTLGDATLLEPTELGARLTDRPISALSLQESLRLALEDGSIVRHEGHFELTREIPYRELSEVLGARIDKLSADARSIALAAAVLARSATSSELAKVSGMKPNRAAPALGDLVRTGIVERLTDGRDRTLYAMHDRYADAVLSAAREPRVRATRGRAGRMLARQHAKDFRGLGRAAFELEQAGDTARAIRTIERAAELAVEAGRPEHAARLIAHELRLRSSDDDRRNARLLAVYDLAARCGLEDLTGNALMELADRATASEDKALLLEVELRGARQALRDGDPKEARTQCEAALERAREGGFDELACQLSTLGGQIELADGTLDRCLARYRSAAEHATALGRPDLEAAAQLGVALVYVRLGLDAESTMAAQRAVAAANRAQDPVLRSDALRMLGNAHYVGGRRAQALRSYRRAVKVARESGSAESEAKALNNVATCAHALGSVREALSAWKRAIVLKERVGATASAQLTWASMSGVLTIMGQREEAREAQQRVMDTDRGDARASLSLAWSNRGDLECAEGDLDAAIEAFAQGERGYREIGMNQLRTHALGGAIRAHLMRGRPGDVEKARELLTAFEEIVSSDSAHEDQRRLTTARAMVRDAEGDAEGALAEARRALKIGGADTSYEDIFGSPVDAQWMIALLLHRLGKAGPAAKAAKRAKDLVEKRAKDLDDDAFRRRFREDHPLHRAILAGDRDHAPGSTWAPARR